MCEWTVFNYASEMNTENVFVYFFSRCGYVNDYADELKNITNTYRLGDKLETITETNQFGEELKPITPLINETQSMFSSRAAVRNHLRLEDHLPMKNCQN